jgi:hypothetical protein
MPGGGDLGGFGFQIQPHAAARGEVREEPVGAGQYVCCSCTARCSVAASTRSSALRAVPGLAGLAGFPSPPLAAPQSRCSFTGAVPRRHGGRVGRLVQERPPSASRRVKTAAVCSGAQCRPTPTARVLNVGNHRTADGATP